MNMIFSVSCLIIGGADVLAKRVVHIEPEAFDLAKDYITGS